MRYADPEAIYIIGASIQFKQITQVRKLHWINTIGDLGHHGRSGFPAGQRLGGWSAGLLLGCLICYHDKVDMIYKEQDCLAFGPWVQRLYAEIGAHPMISGRPNTGEGGHGGLTANSLILIRWESLLDFVAKYSGDVRGDADHYPEKKFDDLFAERFLTRTTMGYDRSRPIGYDDPTFYAQQLTEAELVELRKRNLI